MTAAARARRTLYLDSSALVKLAQIEAETPALRRYLQRHRSVARVTCALARVEVLRALAPGGPRALALGRRQLARFHQLELDRELLDRAAGLPPPGLRSLDALHLAAAQTLPGLRAVVTYDARMQEAADGLGLPVEAPA
ncbi:MAG TPA: type II toxin-antitoxin system VapC family toxin [Acidimicrobiia bacterium]|nr:type II toxin-antitoxin system VapC family toxin [Acidimicrobiia bacterium]